MKVFSSRMALHMAILIAFSPSAHAQDKAAVSQRELQAKIDYCKTCHGFSGQGYRGFYPMPRLAGQQTASRANRGADFSASPRKIEVRWQSSPRSQTLT